MRDATKKFVGIALFVPGLEGGEKDLQNLQCRYSPQALREPSSTISEPETISWTPKYSQHPINTSYTSNT
jgi:hypothetical protein